MEIKYVCPGDHEMKIPAVFSLAELKQLRNLLVEEIQREEKQGFQVLERVNLFEKIELIIK